MSAQMNEEERQFLEENIATVAFHLGQPGAKLSVRSDKNALMVDPGEVLKEISRRLTVVPAQTLPPSPHVEYVASRGQSKVTYWVSREEGDRIRAAAVPAKF